MGNNIFFAVYRIQRVLPYHALLSYTKTHRQLQKSFPNNITAGCRSWFHRQNIYLSGKISKIE